MSYSLCQNAAEAATEKVYANMAYDFVNSGGIFTVSNNVANGTYQALVPTAADNSYFTNFNFYNPTSHDRRSNLCGFSDQLCRAVAKPVYQ